MFCDYGASRWSFQNNFLVTRRNKKDYRRVVFENAISFTSPFFVSDFILLSQKSEPGVNGIGLLFRLTRSTISRLINAEFCRLGKQQRRRFRFSLHESRIGRHGCNKQVTSLVWLQFCPGIQIAYFCLQLTGRIDRLNQSRNIQRKSFLFFLIS